MTICERVFNLLGTQRGRQEQLATYIGVKPTTITNWKQRSSDPPAKLIVPICEFLGCSVEYLLTGKDSPPPPLVGMSEEALKLGLMWEELDEAGRAIILGDVYRRYEAVRNAATESAAASQRKANGPDWSA